MTIGLDLGISATKLVLMEDGKVQQVELWEGPFAIERLAVYLKKNIPARCKVTKISTTGVGSMSLVGSLCGIRTERVGEFIANAKAARSVTDLSRFIVVSMGSGTSFVMVDGKDSRHLGGTAMGGGTLYRLFQMLLPGGSWPLMRQLAEKGDLSRIDQRMVDVSKDRFPELSLDTTVVNFGKASQASKPEDITIGLLNLVVQNIGVMAYLAGSGIDVKDFVLIGRMAAFPQVSQILSRIERMYGIHFFTPQYAEYMTALGAAL